MSNVKFFEFHSVQNFPPHCLNRGDLNGPKDCDLGAYKRARISSQCVKRAIRLYCRENGLLLSKNLSVRTRRVPELVAEKVVTAFSVSPENASAAVSEAMAAVGITKKDGEAMDDVMIFLSNSFIDKLASFCSKHMQELLANRTPETKERTDVKKKPAKKEAKAYSDEMKNDIESVRKSLLKPSDAVDISLFGRMIATMPEAEIDAACQVAHAISTNRLASDFDYFTAVDDFNRSGDAGAAHLDTAGFNSSCFYRYSNVDYPQLLSYLENDTVLAKTGLYAFLKASVLALPSGKQNSYAAFTVPDFVVVVVRSEGQPQSLVNAFVQPAQPNGDLVQESIEKLTGYQQKLSAFLSDTSSKVYYAGIKTPQNPPANWVRCENLNDLLSKVVAETEN